ncbi:MAG: phospholipase D family protein [Candidatus Eremiobacterota bacterium]
MDPISTNIYGAGRTGRPAITRVTSQPVQAEEHIEEKPEKKISLSQDQISLSDTPAEKQVEKKRRIRNLKGETKKLELKKAIKEESFEQIDEDASIETSLARFKKVRRELQTEPVTKEEETQSRLALRDLKKIRKELRSGGVRDGQNMQDVRLLTEHFTSVKNSYNRDKRERQLESIEDKVPGGMLNYVEENFFMNGNIPSKDMVEVVKITRELEKEKSAYKIEGNRVEPLEREEIWQRKMHLLDNAVENTRRKGDRWGEVNVGNVEVDAEYYELGEPKMLEKLKDIASHGGKVRVLMDSGRLAYKKPGVMDASQIAYRMETLSELQGVAEKNNMGLVLFPTKEELGSTGNLMHRKLLRVGDKVIIGGMNANSSSGENIDYAKEIEGPAAKRLTEIYKRDVANSAGKNIEEIYGKQQLDIIRNGEVVDEKTGETKKYDVTLSPYGLMGLLKSCVPDEKRAEIFDRNLPKEQQIDKMITVLAEKGIDPAGLAHIPGTGSDSELKDYLLSHGKECVAMTDTGRKLMAERLEEMINRTKSDGNMEKLSDISPADGTQKGRDTVAIGDLPEERQAILLNTINSAKEFIHMPAFVLTKDLAEALVAKKKEMEASRKKDFDIKVIMDPGLYPHGGTPNEAAYKILENNNIPVRWALLDRSADHDRKVHAKMMVTDNAILSGSTNFSGKGMRDNWEMSDVMFVNKENSESIAKRDNFDKDFQRLWDKESININTKSLAEEKYAGDTAPDAHLKKEEHRDFLLRLSIRNIENYEKEIGRKFSEAAKESTVKAKIGELMAGGMDKGYATLKALETIYPSDKLEGIRKSTEAWQSLSGMVSREG